MSRQDKLDPSKIEDGRSGTPIDDDLLQVDLRLGLDEVAAAEAEELRNCPRRRPTARQLEHLASNLYDARRARDQLFKDKLFGEPAWDMMLALYFFPRRGIFLSVMSLGRAARIPPTTGLRWQKLLEDRGLIERGPADPLTREQLIRLTELGSATMSKYLLRLYYCEGPTEANLD